MKKTVYSMNSTPLVNLLQYHALSYQDASRMGLELSALYVELYRELHHQGHKDKVALHKKVFGKQDYCFTSYQRSWVWHGPNDLYRVFVSNSRGIYFEVNEDRVKTFPEGLKLFREYIDTLMSASSANNTCDDNECI